MVRSGSVLVTGAGGFIGSRLAIALAKDGPVVAAIGSVVPEVCEELEAAGCTIEVGSVTDFDFVRGLLSLHEIDTVYHLAAYSIVRLSARDPMSTYQVNVMGTVNVLEACRTVGKVRKIVVASSDKAYGDHDDLPYTEEHPLQPLNTYDTSKACVDMISRSYAHNYDMPVVVTRSSNVYGPGDRNWSRIVPNTIRRILDGQDAILYSDVAEMVREFVYVDDVVDAYIKLGASGPETDGKAYNIGGTQPERISNLVDRIIMICDADVGVEVVAREPTFREIQRQFIDSSRLREDTGWVPEVDLIEGLKRTITWMEGLQ